MFQQQIVHDEFGKLLVRNPVSFDPDDQSRPAAHLEYCFRGHLLVSLHWYDWLSLTTGCWGVILWRRHVAFLLRISKYSDYHYECVCTGCVRGEVYGSLLPRGPCTGHVRRLRPFQVHTYITIGFSFFSIQLKSRSTSRGVQYAISL